MRKGREGVGAEIMSLNKNCMKDGPPHALDDFNPTSLLALTSVRGLRILGLYRMYGDIKN